MINLASSYSDSKIIVTVSVQFIAKITIIMSMDVSGNLSLKHINKCMPVSFIRINM